MPVGWTVGSLSRNTLVPGGELTRARAWSTMKVPVIVACITSERADWHDVELAITRSDNDAALRLWSEARDPRGTLVERYLRRRGLELADNIAGTVLRFHPALRYEGRDTPGMIALYRDLRTDRPCGIHRTFLRPDATKIARPKMFGRSGGAAIKLDADDEVELGLVIGEGIETTLSARALGFRPAWALGSAQAIARLPVLGGIEGLTICGETDDASRRNVLACARRWTAAGVDVSVLKPDAGDLNNVLLARRAS